MTGAWRPVLQWSTATLPPGKNLQAHASLCVAEADLPRYFWLTTASPITSETGRSAEHPVQTTSSIGGSCACFRGGQGYGA
jgi:hypothetical protein